MNKEVQQAVTNESTMEIMEVVIHTILYIRKIYPYQVFRKRKVFNIPVQLSVYPKLNKYISDMMLYAKELLATNRLNRVHISVYECSDAHGTAIGILEHYIIATHMCDNEEPIDKTVDEYRLDLEQKGRDAVAFLEQNLKDYKPLAGLHPIFKIYLEITETAYIDICQGSAPHVKDNPLYLTELNRDGTKLVPKMDEDLLAADVYTQTAPLFNLRSPRHTMSS